MLKTIIMDFDGLIVDTEVVWYGIYKDWFQEEKGYPLSVQEFLACVGSNAESLFGKLDEKGIHVDREAFVRDTQQCFIERSSQLPAKDGVEAFLKNAKEQGLKVLLATSSGRRKPTVHLERLGLMQYFDELVTAEDVERIKPAPDLFLKAAEKAGCRPQECLVVEDSLNGLKAGLNADMKVMVVPNDVTKYCEFEGQSWMLPSLAQADIPTLILDF